MTSAEIIGNSVGIGLGFALCGWAFDHVFGLQSRDYIDAFLIASFASTTALFSHRRKVAS